MANYFLKVDKSLFGTGLNPLEILLLSQIAEFQNNTGDCFISDKALADNFGVSESTISRTIKGLEAKGLIVRTTRNVRGGKERHISVDVARVAELTSGKMTVDNSLQTSKCQLTTSKLTVDKPQNELIKDNIIDNEKDNNCFLLPNGNKKGVALASAKAAAIEPVEERKPQIMTAQEALKKYGVSACANRVKAGIANCYWINGELVKLV